MVQRNAALAGFVALAFTALAWAQPASAQAPADPADLASIAESAESVIVEIPTSPKRKEIYKFFRDLDSNAVCPMDRDTPRGYACAEITYDVLDTDGNFIRRCNVPIFRLNELALWEYSVTTFKKYDCSKTKKKLELEHILLKDILSPRTSDKTVFKPVSVIGLSQVKELCKVSNESCVSDLFDHKDQLSFKAVQSLWGVGQGASHRMAPPIVFKAGWPSDSPHSTSELPPSTNTFDAKTRRP